MSTLSAKRVFLTKPKTIEIQDIELEPIDKKSVVVKTKFSGISHGTELALYRGTAPQLARPFDKELRLFPAIKDRAIPEVLNRGLGYENVGEVIEVGSEVRNFKPGDLLWCWAPHITHYVFEEGKEGAGWPPPLGNYSAMLPAGVSPEEGIFTALSEIALTGVHDANIKVGDDVAVFGAGVIGLLITQFALLSGARKVFVSEPIESRRMMAQSYGAIVLDPTVTDVSIAIRELTQKRGADISIETSGNQRALHEAIRCTGLGGQVVTLGFYQGGAPNVFFGEEWHHNRITMKSSMSAWLCPSRFYPQWDIKRSFETVLELIECKKLNVANMITHRIPFEQAADAYRKIDEHPEEIIKIVLVYL